MKKLIYFLTLFFSVAVTAQESKIIDKLSEYNFSAELLTEAIADAHPDADHSFDVTITTITDSTSVVEKAKFDPYRENGERWILLSYNGQYPSKKEIKYFNKGHNKKENIVKREVEESSWDIELDNDEYLVVGFKYNRAALPAKYKFLADCRGKAYFNKNTKQLEKAEFVNEKPLKVWPLKVNELFMIVNYSYNEKEKIYQVNMETLNMNVKAFGKKVPSKYIYEYSNYKNSN